MVNHSSLHSLPYRQSSRNFTVIVQVGQLPRSWRGLRFSLSLYGMTRKNLVAIHLPWLRPTARRKYCENSDAAIEKHANLRQHPSSSLLFAALPPLFPLAGQSLIPTLVHRIWNSKARVHRDIIVIRRSRWLDSIDTRINLIGISNFIGKYIHNETFLIITYQHFNTRIM